MDLMETTMKRERQFLITWIYSQIYDHRIRLHASILGVQRFLEEWLIYPPKALIWHDPKEMEGRSSLIYLATLPDLLHSLLAPHMFTQPMHLLSTHLILVSIHI